MATIDMILIFCKFSHIQRILT